MTDTSTYKLNHSCIRVKDPKASIAFYALLGLSLIEELKFPDWSLDLYFVAQNAPTYTSHGNHLSNREAVIELSHPYRITKTHSGNEDPKGFGHICVSVDNIQAVCKVLSDSGYKFQSPLENGTAYVLDPDGYWVQLIAQNAADQTGHVTITDAQCYKVNHTMLRVKDKAASLTFYHDLFGMTCKHEHRNPQAGFDSVFLGCGPDGAGAQDFAAPDPDPHREGLLELRWYYGTEKRDGKVYHDGNSDPEGFGHLCVSVDDIHAACERFDTFNVKWQKRLMDGPFRVGFLYDPDGYLVEIIQNERYKPIKHDL